MLAWAPCIGFLMDFPSRVLSRVEVNFKDQALLEWCHTSVASSTIYRRVTIRFGPLPLMANYIKIKRVELAQSCIIITVEGNWTLEEWEGIEDVEREIRNLKREVEGRIDKDNVLKSKMTWDCHLLLRPSKKLKNCLLCEGGLLE